MPHRIIHLHAAAPTKPSMGGACNGCGVCCAAEPCPAGMWISRRRRGRCRALTWDGGTSRYHCGALVAPRRWLPWLPSAWALALVRRWISAGSGCDCDFDVTAAPQGRNGG